MFILSNGVHESRNTNICRSHEDKRECPSKSSIPLLLPWQRRRHYALPLDILYFVIDFLHSIDSELDPMKRVVTNSTGLNVAKIDGIYSDYPNVSFKVALQISNKACQHAIECCL